MKKKTTQLKALLNSSNLEFLMEAHNGISAKIVEEAGFKGIWGSGLALSAQYGVRDNNEASWTQIVEMIEFMSDATTIPILLDGDTGYGNFNNLRRLVQKLEQRGVAGVCIEDKVFPKTNSFIKGEKQQLADISEFAGKIAAGKDSQLDDDFTIVARVEAFIAGFDLKEAIKRAEAYRIAGADGILIHSALSNPSQILAFAKEWNKRCPLIIVPTKYYSTPTEVFKKSNIDLIIWANHLIRGSVDYMKRIASNIQKKEAVTEIEDDIASVNELFRLQGSDELIDAEKKYFNSTAPESKAIVLAASRGDDFDSLTSDSPKTMLLINGKPLLARTVERLKKANIHDIVVVGGFAAEKIDLPEIRLLKNHQFANSGELASLLIAKREFTKDMVVLYGDIMFRGYILKGLMESDREITIVVDSSKTEIKNEDKTDFTLCSESDNRELWGRDIELKGVIHPESKSTRQITGQWIGMIRIKDEGYTWFIKAAEELNAKPHANKYSLADLLNQIIKNGHRIRVIYIHGHWLNINSLVDLGEAGDFSSY